MTLKRNDVVIAFFGQEIKKEPFLIDTETSIGSNVDERDILKKSMDMTAFGQTFNKILPQIEPYLKAVYDNRELPKKREAAINYTADSIGFNAKTQVTARNIQENINQEARKMKPNFNKK